MQARCAINRNGKVFGDNIMVGVAQCTDPVITINQFFKTFSEYHILYVILLFCFFKAFHYYIFVLYYHV